MFAHTLVYLRQRERQAVDFGMDDDFYLPLSHRANDPLETSGIDMATVDTAVPDSNKGYQMLRAMGWKEGVGLGRNEDGAHCGALPVSSLKENGERWLSLLGLKRAQRAEYCGLHVAEHPGVQTSDTTVVGKVAVHIQRSLCANKTLQLRYIHSVLAEPCFSYVVHYVWVPALVGSGAAGTCNLAAQQCCGGCCVTAPAWRQTVSCTPGGKRAGQKQ